MDCLFCKIANGDIASDIVYQDDRVLAFNDINPQAPTHILIIPREHIATINDMEDQHEALVGHMINVSQQLAKQLGFADVGYRVLFNCNRGAGQAVYHIHLHLLGGRPLTWPPG